MINGYDAKDVVIVVDGTYITGVGEDMVTGSKDEDNITTSVGAQGDVVRSRVNNTLGTITLTVQPTCPQLPKLKSLAKKKEPFPIWVANHQLGIKYGGTKADLKKYPDFEFGAESNDLEFEFQVYDYTVI